VALVPRAAALALFVVLPLAACGSGPELVHDAPAPAPEGAPLRSPVEFASITDPAARSRAMFLEASRVLLHPRCVNCHPAGDSPTQGDHLQLHDPPIARGADDDGVPGLGCATCHQDRNVELARVPGAPKWKLAPRVMAWAGKRPPELCAQIKDPKRNGGRTLAAIVDHAEHDALVAWGWQPGSGRVPAPGSQATFGALIDAWVKDGAVCPQEGDKP
jgi:hypothetical protein